MGCTSLVFTRQSGSPGYQLSSRWQRLIDLLCRDDVGDFFEAGRFHESLSRRAALQQIALVAALEIVVVP